MQNILSCYVYLKHCINIVKNNEENKCFNVFKTNTSHCGFISKYLNYRSDVASSRLDELEIKQFYRMYQNRLFHARESVHIFIWPIQNMTYFTNYF